MSGSLSYCCCTRCHSNGDGTVTCGEPHLFHWPPSKQIIRDDYTSVFSFVMVKWWRSEMAGEDLVYHQHKPHRCAMMTQALKGQTRSQGTTHASCDSAGLRGQRARRLAQTKAATLFWGFSWQPVFISCQVVVSFLHYKVCWPPEGRSYSQCRVFWGCLGGCV